jgi:hypothetical protein
MIQLLQPSPQILKSFVLQKGSAPLRERAMAFTRRLPKSTGGGPCSKADEQIDASIRLL